MSHSAILCVDDEVAILETLKEQLVRCFGKCYCYEIAESVEEAWEIIELLQEEGTQIVVIVSDWLMPGIKGDEFLIQVHQRFPQLVSILLTGQADQNAIARAKQEANLYACLYKPWTEEELLTVILSGLGLEKS
ncbi:response regulator receiver protein [Stanieria cyanosphaera PCC 7437]|uniref:Response regulator receiver protein n=1 Tax=Stanieria cyanosphaera (strain ATCC 29371 / PCC 7437) TaxID=111780 RepID=K9XTX4_STAC7|nr:response regulator [Stanieria cyanosphaera]AFZ35526.1 response regulator receiver protein [Stanieria cyanosphaera PCC 7437]